MAGRIGRGIRDQLIGQLPDALYFSVMKLSYSLLDPSRSAPLSIQVIGPRLFRALGASGEIYFCERTRVNRYLWRDGVKRVIGLMREKYSDGEVSVAPGDLVIDVGANIGEFTISASHAASRIIAFEPDPDAFTALQRNASLMKNVLALPIALSNADGRLDFYKATETADSSFFKPAVTAQKITVEARKLDTMIAELGIQRVNFLKVEAEGWEPEVLEGARETLLITDKVALDGGPERDGACTKDAAATVLERAGFQVKVSGNMVFGKRKR